MCRGTRSPVLPGRQPAAGQRCRYRRLPVGRHGFRLDHRACRETAALYSLFHLWLRFELRLRRRAWLRRAGWRRADVLHVQDAALRDGAKGRRYGTGAAAPRLAPGGAAGRAVLPELLCRRARLEIRQGGAVRDWRRRIVRRLSLALLPRRRQSRLRRLRRPILRILAAPGSERPDGEAAGAYLAGSLECVAARDLPRCLRRACE